MRGTAKTTAGRRARRTRVLATGALGLLLQAGLVTAARAAGGAGGTADGTLNTPFAAIGGNGGSGSGGAGGSLTLPNQSGTGGSGGTAYKGAGPTAGGGAGGSFTTTDPRFLAAVARGGSGGTAYKGIGDYAGTGGGDGGTASGPVAAGPGATGGAGGGIGAGGAAGSGQAGAPAGANGNGAGASSLNNTAPLQGGPGGTPGISGMLNNDGVASGTGGGGAGGTGALVTGAGPNSNASTIRGGAGGDGGTAPFAQRPPHSTVVGGGGGGAGGFGAIFTAPNTQFTNAGTVAGGAGGSAGGSAQAGGGGGGAGGVGVLFTSGGTLLVNSGTIAGGTGGSGTNAAPARAPVALGGGGGGEGGTGALIVGDRVQILNSGMIVGGGGGNGASRQGEIGLDGAGGGGGGAGGSAVIALGSHVGMTNTGVVSGGAGGGAVGSTLPVQLGGTGGGEGGTGALFVGNDIRVANSGTMAGGNGGNAGFNVASVGGGGGGGGGSGLLVTGNAARVSNTGAIVGGSGGDGSSGALPPLPFGSAFTAAGGGGGEAGTAVRLLGADARVTNAGAITGGNGGSAGGIGPNPLVGGGSGGDGGAGIAFAGARARLANSGTISGGNGGIAGPNNVPPGTQATFSAGVNGIGGVGVVMSGGTINNTGAINGGLAGDGVTRAFAIALTGRRNFVSGAGQINGGIDVQGTALFQPAVPGAAAGAQPLAINGPLRFASTSTYQVRVGTNQADRVSVNGVATLNGATVKVAAAPVAYRPGVSRYLIVNASGGVAGRFGDLTGGSLVLRPVGLAYDANDVYLTTRKVSYQLPALTWNQRAVAGGLDAANAIAGNRTGQGGKILGAFNVLTDVGQYRAALDSLSGEGITAAQNIAFRSTQLFTSSIFDQTTFYAGGGAANSITLTEPLPGAPAFFASTQPIRELADLPARPFQTVAPAAPNRTWRAWATGFGGAEHISGNAFPIGSATQNNSLYGGSLGVDYQLLPNYLIGVAVGGSNGDFRVDQRGTYGTTTGGHIAIYDLLTLGNWYGASSSSFSYFGNKTTRFVSGFGGLGSETLRGNFDSNQFRSRLEIGRHFSSLPFFGALPTLSGFGTVTPFVAIELASLRSNGFTEYATRGAGLFRLNVSGQSIGSAPAYAGLRFQRITPLGNGMVLSPTLQLAYVHEFAPYRNQIGTLANLPGSTFLVDGARPARDAAQVKAGAELALGPHSAVFANFDGEFSGVNQLYAGEGGFRYVW